MAYFILYAEQQNGHQADSASLATIQGVLQSILGMQDSQCNLTIGGSWVGGPRVTRQATPASIFNFNTLFTRFAALFQYPDSLDPAAVQNCITTIANYQLPLTGQGWQPSRAIAYDSTVNGAVDWWSSGQAADTHTKDAFNLNQAGGATSTVENPVGPQGVAGPADLGAGDVTGSQILSFVTTAMWFVGGAVVLYFAWPLLSGARDVASTGLEASRTVKSSSRPARGSAATQPATVARNNPRRSSRRSRR